MEVQPAPAVAPAKPSRRWKLFQQTENPVILKELRGRMRKRQAVIVLTGYLILIGLVVGSIYASLASESYYSRWDPEFRQTVGKAVFSTVVLMELFMVSLIGPSLTAGAITSEREHQTFDILRTTSLSARSLVLGKLGSSLVYLLLLIITALPIEGIAFLLGGVGLEEMIVSSLMLVVTALFYCALGLFFSSFMKRTNGASVASYVTIVLSYVLLGVIAFVEAIVSVGHQSMESLVNLITWILISTNPLLSAITSEVALVEDQNLWLSSQTAYGQTLLSPWIPYTVIYILLSILMIALSIRFVNRPDR